MRPRSKVRQDSDAEGDLDVTYDEVQERGLEQVRAIAKDVAHGYVAQERVYSPAAGSTAKTPSWSTIVEKVTVDLLAKIVVGMPVAAAEAAIVYLKLF